MARLTPEEEEEMSVTPFRIAIPNRAAWWLAKIAVREYTTVDKLLERWILERLHAVPGVDLSRTPSMDE